MTSHAASQSVTSFARALVHINDQTVNDDAVKPFGGVGASGNGTAIGRSANREEFTHWQWTTIKHLPIRSDCSRCPRRDFITVTTSDQAALKVCMVLLTVERIFLVS
jgi:hypothetical protein